MNKTVNTIFIVVLICYVSIMAANAETQSMDKIDEEKIDFNLNGVEGSWKFSQLRGQVALVFFGYMHCPDICPTTLQTISDTLNKLDSKSLKQVKGLFISLDPDRDTIDNLEKFTAHFHENIIPLTGSNEDVKKVANDMGVLYKKSHQKQSNYSIDHSSLLFLINQSGKLEQALAAHAVPSDYLVEQIQSLIKKQNEQIVIIDPWIRYTFAEAPVYSAYLQIVNHSAKTINLKSVSSEYFDHIMMHETIVENNIMSMVHLTSTEITPGGMLEFKPLGKHLMLSGRKQSLEEILGVPITLHFDSFSRQVDFLIKHNKQ